MGPSHACLAFVGGALDICRALFSAAERADGREWLPVLPELRVGSYCYVRHLSVHLSHEVFHL